MGAAAQAEMPKRFGTFAGVFTPTLLTILGVIMYLRLGWVVGNAGLVGAWLILALAVAITALTGLSLASVATNTRLGAGGPYAIVSRSLGLEVGGSIGVPLYLSQSLAVVMYVFGFREGWLWIFPHHPPLAVDFAVFAAVFALSYISANLAFRVQYGIMAVIAASLVAILAARPTWDPVAPITWWGSFPGSPEGGFQGAGFWVVFAVFFPAATGIMAGANMSGELEDPRRSIPRGTLSAIAVSSVVYFVLAWWLARAGTPEELTSRYTLMIDRAAWAPLVLAGLLGATFSSALSSFVGAPRILQALGMDRIVPGSAWVGRTASNGEPRRALLVTAALVALGLAFRDLNAIAPLITMFFLLTYATINVVVLVEQSLGLVSFRPTLRVPRIVPLLGAIGCIFAMFIVNPTFSLVAVGVVLAIYATVMRRGLEHRDDLRSGMFVAVAEWAAARVSELAPSNVRSWKPNLLVPVEDDAELRGTFRAISDIARPEGAVKLLGLAREASVEDLERRLAAVGRSFRQKGVFTTWSILDVAGYETGVLAALQALRSAFFRPNILFVSLAEATPHDDALRAVIREADRVGVAVMLLGRHPRAGLGETRVVNLWLTVPDPAAPVEQALRDGGLHLAILSAYRLARAWGAQLNVVMPVTEEAAAPWARAFVEEVRDRCRLPDEARSVVLVGDLERAVAAAPQADMDVMALDAEVDLDRVRQLVWLSRSATLFTRDSPDASALA